MLCSAEAMSKDDSSCMSIKEEGFRVHFLGIVQHAKLYDSNDSGIVRECHNII